jgi:hypothetical protein
MKSRGGGCDEVIPRGSRKDDVEKMESKHVNRQQSSSKKR